jgi:hypothetical protein
MDTQILDMLAQDSAGVTMRLNFANQQCSAIYADLRHMFIDTLTTLASRCLEKGIIGGVEGIFHEKDVLEIGCGRDEGLSRFVMEHGARTYVGVDINEGYVKQSQALVRDGRVKFIADEPGFIMSIFPGKYITISSGAMADGAVIKANNYGQIIVRGIARTTRQGEYAIHQTNPFFDELFLRYGFENVFPEIKTWTKVYRKK